MGRCAHRIRLFAAAIAAVAIAFLPSCTDDFHDNSPNGPLELSLESITVSRDGQTAHIGVTARETSWDMTGDEEWCAASPAAGEKGISLVTVTFAPNDAEDALARTATFTFTSGGETRTVSVEQLPTGIVMPNQNEDYFTNEAIRGELDKWYYNGETRTATADYNQSYGDFYTNYLSNLTRNTLDGNVWAMSNERYLYSYVEKNPYGTSVSNVPSLNYGMEFDLVDFDGKLAGRVLYVERGSAAEAAGLRRGDWFYKVNGVQMGSWMTNSGRYQYNRLIDTLVNPVAGESPVLGMLSFQAANKQLVDQGRSVSVTPSAFPNDPILHTQVIESTHVGSGERSRTGYMMYNSFDAKYKNELVNSFATEFAGGGLDNFILDLRYNKSGSVEMAQLVGDLLVGNLEGVSGRTFARYAFDTGSETASPHGKSVQFAPHDSGIGVGTVFVLTSPHTAGASELLINALRGLDQSVVKLVVIGGVTQGLSAGMVKRTYNSDTEWEYSAWMLAFRCYNAEDQGDYAYGLVPNGGEVSEWQGENVKWSTAWGWKGITGSTEDALVTRAMDFISGKAFIPTGGVINASQRQRSGYQREFCFPTNMTMEIDE